MRPKFNKLQSSIVDHCNLTCNNCITYSPFLEAGYYDFNLFKKEIERLAQYVSFKDYEFSGGEVLLHKQIDDFVEFTKTSCISDNVNVYTNGLILHKMTDRFFNNVSLVYVTKYNNSAIDYDELEEFLKEKQKNINFKYEFRLHDKFALINRPMSMPENSELETKEVFDTCDIKSTEAFGCHLLSGGYYYKCGKPNLDNLMYGIDGKQDGVDLFSEEMPFSLYRYLKDQTPLNACKRCNGTKKHWVSHNFIPVEKIKLYRKQKKLAFK